MTRNAWTEILAFVLLGAAAFGFVSLSTYSQGDHLIADRVENACGPVGALLSRQMLFWLGSWGSHTLTAATALLGLSLLIQKRIRNPGWKAVALAILLLTFASLEVAVTERGDFLPGGYYGQFFHDILLARLNRIGSYLLLLVALLVAILISTDGNLLPAVARTGRVALSIDRWRGFGRYVVRGTRPFRALTGLPLARIVERVAAPLRRLREGPGHGGERGDPWRPAPRSRALPPQPRPRPRETAGEAEEGDAAEAAPREEVAPRETESASSSAEAAGDGGGEERTVDDSSPFDFRFRRSGPLERASGTGRAKKRGKYELPPLDLLQAPAPSVDPMDRTIVQETAAKIEETLRNFKIEARVVEVQKGPVITQYEISLAAGIKVHKIVSLADDLAMALKAESIRIVAPIPGKATVGIEVPNRSRITVGLRELLESREMRGRSRLLPLALGKDIAGAPIIGDLGDMPHLLLAGSTGSGKSVCINSVIINFLMTKSPDELKLILIDPKMVELSSFEEIPHLLTPVVTDMKKAPAVLNWLVEKMDERYELLALAGVRHLTAYNALGRKELRTRLAEKLGAENIDNLPDFLPQYVVIIDELADLMMSASKEVEGSITRLSQKSRAVGIHVVLATQRPSVDVITGLIKANMPCRISFHVTSKVDSRTILDRNGADKLLGKGDMLFLPPGTSNLVRAQGTFISDREINAVVKFVREKAQPQFDEELSRFGLDGASDVMEEDELYEDAVRIVLESQRGSVTLLQRQLQIGYTRASRLMELMAANGLVGPFKGSKAREVYYTLDEWEAARNRPSTG